MKQFGTKWDKSWNFWEFLRSVFCSFWLFKISFLFILARLQIWEFLRSVFCSFWRNCAKMNRKLILKIPRFVPFCAGLAKYKFKSDTDDVSPAQRPERQRINRWDNNSCVRYRKRPISTQKYALFQGDSLTLRGRRRRRGGNRKIRKSAKQSIPRKIFIRIPQTIITVTWSHLIIVSISQGSDRRQVLMKWMITGIASRPQTGLI